MPNGNDEDSNAVEHQSISVPMDSVHRIDITDDEKNAILDSVESKRFSLQEDTGKIGHYYSEDIDLDRAQKEPHHLTRRAHKRETRAFINDKHNDNPLYPAHPLSMDDEGYAEQVDDIIYGATEHALIVDEPLYEIEIAESAPVASRANPTKPTTPAKSIGYSPCRPAVKEEPEDECMNCGNLVPVSELKGDDDCKACREERLLKAHGLDKLIPLENRQADTADMEVNV
jgi:hypothetical protein